MYHCRMRKVEEKHVANQIDLMVWSNRLDLLAISNFKGEVQVHRLRLQKVCSFPPPKEEVLVKAMAWRPDGKALCIGYSNGSVHTVDIEDKEVIAVYDFEKNPQLERKDCSVSCITWAVRDETLESASEYNIYDDASLFLQKPPSLSSGFKEQSSHESFKDFKEIQEPTQLNMLIIGYSDGYIYMSIFGRYPYGTVSLSQVTKDDYGENKILDITLSDDFSAMQILYSDKISNNIFLAVINTSTLSAHAEEIFVVANRHGQIIHLVSYLDQTMVSIIEAWEHILLEMDNKMAYFAASVPEGGVSADLLELLMLGVPSDELELFLLQELTAKGLKKFGSSVELSYSTIQKLVLKQLNIVAQSLVYYLAELRGLTKIPDRYKVMGLEESNVTEAIKAGFAFLNKCLELQQVIDVSMRNYKAFFRWLFVVIVRLLDEQTPSEIVKITQQELSHIVEFLYNFDNVHTENSEKVTNKPKFNLERLGQYLQDQNLTILPDDDDNPWKQFLQENICLVKDSDTFFSMAEFKKFSLVQQQNHLKNAINKVFDANKKDISKNFSLLFNIRCYDKLTTNEENIRFSQFYDAVTRRFMTAFVNTATPTEDICFLTVKVDEKIWKATATTYIFDNLIEKDSTRPDHMHIVDLQFYSSEYLSVLAIHNNTDCTYFIQLPLAIAVHISKDFNLRSQACVFNEKTSRINISDSLDHGVYKAVDKMDGFRIAVSGGRKVAVVLSKNLRKVKVFEMEADGDDEEDESLDVTPQEAQAMQRDD